MDFSSERQYADSLTKETTRQLLADRLWYGRIKLSWDPNYFAAKKKKLADRIASRDEFSKPLDPVPEKIEFNQEENTIPIETYVEHQQLELRHDHDVNINNLVPIPDTSVDIVPIRPGDTD